MNLFFADPKDIHKQHIVIRGQEANHIKKVLRYSIGDTLHATDGQGSLFECRITNLTKDKVHLDVMNVDTEKKKLPGITLCLGIIKKRDRLEFAVEKAVELGVSQIVLFRGDYSEKGKVREDRLLNTSISAMKQSLRLFLPGIFVEETLQKAIELHRNDATVVVADEKLETQNRKAEIPDSKHYFLVVGPEGGFSENEREILNNCQPLHYSLGEKRLRTETAAVVMVHRFSDHH